MKTVQSELSESWHRLSSDSIDELSRQANSTEIQSLSFRLAEFLNAALGMECNHRQTLKTLPTMAPNVSIWSDHELTEGYYAALAIQSHVADLGDDLVTLSILLERAIVDDMVSRLRATHGTTSG